MPRQQRRERGRWAVSSASLSSRSPWLAHARPNYRSRCWRRVTLRVPAVLLTATPRKLGQTRALLSPWAPLFQSGRGAPGLRAYKYVNLSPRYWFLLKQQSFSIMLHGMIIFGYINMFHLALWHHLLIFIIIDGWNLVKKRKKRYQERQINGRCNIRKEERKSAMDFR